MTTTRTDGPSAEEQSALFVSLYNQLRRLAQRELRRRAGCVSLSATTLLHEAYFKMKERPDAAFPDEASFLAYAARAMRTLVIDYARSRHAQKRGGAFEITRLPTEMPGQFAAAADLERLAAAIDALAVHDNALAQLVDLKFFCGYSLIEIAAMRGISERTAQRDWDKARMVLKRALDDGSILSG